MRVAREDNAALDESSLSVVDAGTLEDEGLTASEEDATPDSVSLDVDDVVVLEDETSKLADDDDSPIEKVGDGTTTIPVGVADDSKEPDDELCKENVGNSWVETSAELRSVIGDAAGVEREELLDGTLTDEDNIEPRLEVWDGGAGRRKVADVEANRLETMFDPAAEDVWITELDEIGGEFAGTELEYCGEGTGTTTVTNDDDAKLVPLLVAVAEEVPVGYPAELGMIDAGRLDLAEEVCVELRGSGMATV